MILCNITALRYHRVPLVCRDDLHARISRLCHAGARALLGDEVIAGYLGSPLHTLVGEDSKRGRCASQYRHLFRGELSFGALWRLNSYLEVASPELALLGLAPFLSPVQLSMLVHEVCGGFVVVDLPSAHRIEVQGLVDRGWHGGEGWSPVLDARRRLTDLWQRPPLVDVSELRVFAERNKGRRGAVPLLRAAEGFMGEARSPFEVRAALQYGLSRWHGGEGLDVVLNERIPLNQSAQALCGQSVCFADLLITSRDKTRQLIVECQSGLIHSAADRQLRDFDRQAALTSMGYEYLPLTYGQLAQPHRHRSMVRLMAEKLGDVYRDKTPNLSQRERALRNDLYVDWNSIGPQGALRVHSR